MTDNLIWSVFEILINCIECAAFLLFPRAVLGVKRSWTADAVLFAAAFIALLGSEYVYSYVGVLVNLLYVVFIYLYCLASLKGTFAKKMAVAFVPSVIAAMVNSMAMSILSFAFAVPVEQFFLRSRERALVMLGSKLLYVVSVYYMVGFYKNNRKLETKQWVTVAINFFLADMANSLLIWYMDAAALSLKHQAVLLAASGCVLFMGVFTFVMVAKFSKENEIKTQNCLLIQEKTYLNRNMDSIRQGSEEINGIKHDIKNYIMLIHRQIDSGEYDKAMEECRRVIGRVETVETIVETGSLTVDLVLNERLGRCKRNGIDIKCCITTDLAPMQGSEGAAALANLLDNAIEYTLGIDKQKRELVVDISQKLGFYRMRVGNRVLASVLKDNPQLQTTKKDKQNHGLGHKNVERYAISAGGKIRYFEEENFFYAELIIPIYCE